MLFVLFFVDNNNKSTINVCVLQIKKNYTYLNNIINNGIYQR